MVMLDREVESEEDDEAKRKRESLVWHVPSIEDCRATQTAANTAQNSTEGDHLQIEMVLKAFSSMRDEESDFEGQHLLWLPDSYRPYRRYLSPSMV